MAFTELFLKIVPLYFLILIGFMVGRRTKVVASELASINLYYIAPLIIFDAISHLPFKPENIVLPLVCFNLLSLLGLIVFCTAKLMATDRKLPYWFTGACSTTNTGYFGIPVFISIFGIDQLGIYMLYVVGAAFYFYIVTTYLFIRNHYSFKEAIGKIIRLPILHAMLVALVCQAVDFRLPTVFDQFFVMLRGAYVVMGMMIIGLVLGRQSERGEGFVFEWQLILSSNAVRFLLYPALALSLVLLDWSYVHFFSPMAEKIILLVSMMPMGADTTSLAAQWNTHPERIAALTLVNSILALFVIPLVLPVLLAF